MADLFDFGERLGLFLIVEVASLSAIATGALLLYILVRVGFTCKRAQRVNTALSAVRFIHQTTRYAYRWPWAYRGILFRHRQYRQ